MEFPKVEIFLFFFVRENEQKSEKMDATGCPEFTTWLHIFSLVGMYAGMDNV